MIIALPAAHAPRAVQFARSALINGTLSTERAGGLGVTGVVSLPHGVVRLANISEQMPHPNADFQARPTRYA
jgi:hypothetical protein